MMKKNSLYKNVRKQDFLKKKKNVTYIYFVFIDDWSGTYKSTYYIHTKKLAMYCGIHCDDVLK